MGKHLRLLFLYYSVVSHLTNGVRKRTTELHIIYVCYHYGSRGAVAVLHRLFLNLFVRL